MCRTFPGNKRFEVLSMLGRGGMGVVYEVFDRERQVKVAIKTLNEGSPKELLRLKNEFRALQELEHPNLIQLGELFEEDGTWFFTMELIAGVDFITHIRLRDEGSLFHEQRLRRSLIQLVDALAYLHASDRVHRDIKPENVLVESTGRIVLLDFGLVTQTDPGQLSQEGFYPVGTASFMAPEQAASLQVGPEADWYAVGVMLFEALTGTHPFTGTFSQLLIAKFAGVAPQVRELRPDVPPDLDRLCAGLLAHDPDKRPGAAEILRILRREAEPAGSNVVSMGTRMPLFVGRGQELAWIGEGQAAVAGSGLQVRLIHGTSGLGKSELLRMAGRELLGREPNALLLWGRCNERESVSYKAFDGVVDALGRFMGKLAAVEIAQLLPRNVEPLARVFPVLSFLRDVTTVTGRARQATDLQEVRSQAFGALRELLSRLADRRPVMIVLDDLQWVDEDSLKLLRALLQSPDAPAVCIVMGLRTPAEPGEAAAMVGRFCDQLPIVPGQLSLGPLPPEAAGELVSTLLATEDARSVGDLAQVAAIAQESAGHPLFIHELVRHLQSQTAGDLGGDLRLDDVLWKRIGSLEAPSRHLVELVSLSFGPLRQGLAALALGIKSADVFRLAARLKILHLVRTSGPREEDLLEPYHDRVREAVHSRMDSEGKQKWHRLLVTVLRSSIHTEPERLAAHLEVVGASEEASALYAAVAERAVLALAFNRAAGLYEHAISLLPGTDDSRTENARRDLRLRMGHALSVAGRGREAASALLAAVPGAQAAEALDLRRRAAEQLLISGFLDEGFDLSGQVLRSLGLRLPRTTLGAVASLAWRRFLVRLRGTRFRERNETQIPRTDLVNVDILHSIARGLSMTDHIRGADFTTRFLLAALRMGEPGRILAAMTIEANNASGMAPGSAYSRRILSSCDSMLERRHDAVAGFYLDAAHGISHFMTGDWSSARARFETCIEHSAGLSGMAWERGLVHFQLMWSLFYLGELAEMYRRIPPLLQDARDRGDLFTVSGLTLGLNNIVILDRDGPERAEQEIREVLSRWTVRGYHLQHYWALLSRVHANLYNQRHEQTLVMIENDWKTLKSSFLLHVPAIRSESLILQGRSLLARAMTLQGTSRRSLLSMVPVHAKALLKGKAAWSRALGALLEATWQAQSGREEQALRQLRLVIDQLDTCGMRLYAAAARIRLGRLEGGETGADLVARGRSFMRQQGVKNEAGMLQVLVPGFDDV
ncbi:protein kinase [Myxococcota bacterium]|nr:protein kinase [Myxococcota bacterium]